MFRALPLLLAALTLVACGPKTAPVKPPAVARAPVAPAAMQSRLDELARGFDGRVGIAVKDIDAGWTAGVDQGSIYPQQSVRKLWVAVALMDGVDHGRIRLDEPVTIRREDLSVFHQPMRNLVGPNGYATTYDWLLTQALTKSDNAANDALLRRVGGGEAVETVLRAKHLAPIRIGPLEPLLQSAAAGVQWRPEYAFDWAFQYARDKVPAPARRAALDAYLSNPTDGATPQAIVDGLARLKSGTLLSRASSDRLLVIMSQSQTGPKRLHAGLGEGWTMAHKTGTGQDLGAVTAGYNDVAVLTAPDGHAYAVAVMIARTTTRLEVRQALMAEVARAVVAQHDRDHPPA